jgi:dynein heavy chain, axonemal
LTSIRDEITEAALKPTVDIGWLRVNATPLIKELEKTAGQWIAAYTGFLLDNTTREIANIEHFINEVNLGTLDPPKTADKKADKERLMRVMTHLRDVKMIKDRTLEEIEPMKQAVMLLKKHASSLPKEARMMDEDFLVKLENAKTALVEVSERALGPTKEAILPLQTAEAKDIKTRLRGFTAKVGEYRLEFLANCPYHVTASSPEIIAKAYDTINTYYVKTGELEDEARELNNLETLFDMQKSSYKQLKECKTELCLLKQLWDLVSLIDFQFEAWKLTLWDKIDTENLMQLIREMQTKQCNPQAPANKEIKSWKAFVGLNDRVKNMNTILPLISQLHSKFMQERHWKKLMVFTRQ